MLLLSLLCATALGASPRAGVLQDSLPQTDAGTARILADAVREAGYEVVPISGDLLSDWETLAKSKYDLLVIPNARTLPMAAVTSMQRYLEAGGDLIACGLPAWDQLVVKIDGNWRTRSECETILGNTRAQKMIVDFEREDLTSWRRSSNVAEPIATVEVVAAPKGNALHVVAPHLTGWETLAKAYPKAFPDGHTLTCFRAKGDQGTKQMLVEWMEKDGSRWIATVNLTTQWKDYALPPEAFVAWQPPAGRGGAADHLRVENVQQLSIGLGISHGDLPVGRHEYWFDDLGTAPNPLGAVPRSTEVPHLEALSPGYLTYPVTGPVTIRATGGQAFVETMSATAPASLVALHPRPAAAGFNKGQPYRWQTLLYAQAENGDYRGAIAAMVIPTARRYRGSVWAAFTPSEAEFYRNSKVQRVITQTARAMRRGAFLQEGGAEYYTAFKDQAIPLGASVMQIGSDEPGQLTVNIRVVAPDTPATSSIYEQSRPVQAKRGQAMEFSDTLRIPESAGERYTVITELRQKDQAEPLDRLSHELYVYQPKGAPRFIESRDGGFFIEGKPWKAHGVNYMPSSGIGQPSNAMFEQWLGASAYDPEIIERDLGRIKAMNLNSVSIFLYHQSLKPQNLLDFLRRCQAKDVKVNLSLRPGTPLDFQWPLVREMIQTLRLAENDTVFTYDLAWEPSHFDHKHQTQYVPAWKEWVVKRYGTLEDAQKAWGVPCPAENGRFSVPPVQQLVEDGAWRKMVADYRAFLDDMLRGKYAEARRLVRSIDPNHAVSFRMQMSGDPTFNNGGLLPYDLFGLADAVDIWEPEAYGRIGDWEMVKPGHFTAAYARLCDPKKPVLWAEMGVSVWDNSSMSPNAGKLEFQAQYYRDFYRMMIQSGADGVFYWWYPGGYRLNEKSDYGILNADGTDRAVTKVIRQEAARFLAAGKPTGDEVPIAVDRDRDARGLFGIYQAAKKEYWQAVDSGKIPALQWERRPGERR